MYKTAAFIKRNWLVFIGICGRCEYTLLKVWKGIKHGVAHMVHGMKDIAKDGVWLGRKYKQAQENKYEDVSYRRKSRMRQVKTDLIKFVPFSFFLIIPGAELLLPPWILIFPNSVPS